MNQLGLFDRSSVPEWMKAVRQLPDLPASPWPWSVAKSKRSVNLPDGGKVRLEAGMDRETVEANCRLIASAGGMQDLLFECMYALAELDGRTEDQDEVLGMLADHFSWLHGDPSHGATLRRALGLPEMAPREEQRPRYG
jgi:hypothetical protein